MQKIKINLTSGNVVEKPLVTAFKGTSGDYIVLDNESLGSMGLPVILISKIQDNHISTIVDANEWNTVKENLRNIIGGNQMIKANVLSEYVGDDIYYKQLTLPVASFEALKKTYGDEVVSNPAPAAPMPASEPVGPAAPVTPQMPNVSSVGPMPTVDAPVAPTVPEAPVAPVTPEAPIAPSPVEAPSVTMVPPTNVNPDVATPEEVTPVAPVGEPVSPVSAPQMEVPTPEAPVAPEMPNVSPVGPMPAPEPTVEPIPPISEAKPINFEEEKATFLKACENMFDALVSKFNK